MKVHPQELDNSLMNRFEKPGVFMRIIYLAIILATAAVPAYAQLKEPNVEKADLPETPLKQGYSNRIGGGIVVNNFGFGVDGMYGRTLGPFTELTFSLGIGGIRDASEQKFTNFFTGQRIIPAKYNRVLGIPLLAGVKQRIFPGRVADNFRFFVAAAGGPALGLVYPYINDNNPPDGHRSFRYVQVSQGLYAKVPTEDKRGFFGALGEATSKFGASGRVRIGMDLGKSFKHQFTISLGYSFYYFPQGVQILDPKRTVLQDNGLPELDENGNPINEDAFDKQFFSGTPQITFTYSGWW